MTFPIRPLLLATLCAVAAPALADNATAIDGVDQSKARAAQLIEFTGSREFLKTSSRLRVWRGEMDFTLAVNAAGTPTEWFSAIRTVASALPAWANSGQ